MKDYEEKVINIMDSAKDNIRLQLDKAYKSGYEDAKSELGKKVINLAHEESDRAYQQGLEDAWEAAKKIHSGQIPYEVFGLAYGESFACPLNWDENMSASEVVAKKKEYEDKQKQATEIKVGDEVDYHGDKYIVTLIANSDSSYMAISADGSHMVRASRDNITFTGRHFDQISEVLAEMRGE